MNYPVWIEVEQTALEHNLLQVKGLVGPGVKICAVVKADAYGHGAVEASKIFLASGADMLAVTRVDEALALRSAGISTPILVLDSSPTASAPDIVENDLEQTVCTHELASALSAVSAGVRKTAKVHVKVDTGMGRLGLLPQDVTAFARYITTLPGIEIAGTYTHFSKAFEPGLGSTAAQFRGFQDVLQNLTNEGLPTGLTHAANSAAIIRLPDSRLDMVRPGTILYGQYPSASVPRQLELKNGWTLKARISFLKKVPAGYKIGYGGEFITKKESKIAVLPIGYGDGFTVMPESLAKRQYSGVRALANVVRRPGLFVTVRGARAPIIGRIAMQMCTIDVTDIPGVEIGDEVTLSARRVTMSSAIPRIVI